MKPKEYIVDHISGDYAMLRRTDAAADGLNQVALALLPDGLQVGSRLRWEMFSYTLI
ncbi:MAG: chorismate--pyruvate lyase [Oscillospiraceae bacterium]|nr:chorismate--pyruvate lyase [Oscillospiraceae bacterium]